ncbi:MAG: sulfatase family protein [Thermoleophilaceae bacterium]
MIRALLAAAFLVLLLAAPASAQEDDGLPNLLVVMTDDQRAQGTMAVMPETRRKIGRQGTTYSNAHATTPKCCPSRASFFTGRYAHNHGVISNSRGANLDQSHTVQRLLQQRGYLTGIFGKYLNAWPVEVSPPFFDEWAISNGGFENTFWNLDGRVRRKHRYATDLVADWALQFVRQAERRDDTQPWLAWVTPYAPHLPSTPAQRHSDARLPSFPLTPAMQETDLSDKPDFLEAARHQEERLAAARDDGRRTLIAVDEMVRRLMDELRKQGEAENTLVVFTSDNGFMLGEHGGVVGKDLPYPASTGIPLLVRWPGHFRAGRKNSKLVANIDVAATLLDAAGVERQTDGRSLLEPGRRSALLVESRGSYSEDRAPRLPGFRSILTKNYRFAEYYRHDTFDLMFREYYNLGIDPWELENRAPELSPERRAELSDRLEEYGTCRGSSCP